MSLQKACETLEELSQKESKTARGKITLSEFMAIQAVLLELQVSGKYEMPEKYSKDI